MINVYLSDLVLVSYVSCEFEWQGMPRKQKQINIGVLQNLLYHFRKVTIQP